MSISQQNSKLKKKIARKWENYRLKPTLIEQHEVKVFWVPSSFLALEFAIKPKKRRKAVPTCGKMTPTKTFFFFPFLDKTFFPLSLSKIGPEKKAFYF